MSDISVRLRQVLKNRGRNISWLHRQVDASGVRGSSYGSVYNYVKGKASADPPLEWIREASKVLRVDPRWLAFGEPSDADRDEAVRDEVARRLRGLIDEVRA